MVWNAAWRANLPWAGVAPALGIINTLPDGGALSSLVATSKQFGDGYLVSKQITYAGEVSYDAFTVTGLVAVQIVGYQTTVLTDHGDSTSVGTATSAAGLIAATPASTLRAAGVGAIWIDNTPAKFESAGLVATRHLIGAGEDIAVVGTANITGGVIMLHCFWKPLSADGNVVAA
jgi:hypothetical protein